MTTAYDVHVMGSDGTELRCIRVPVTATSTIRQLATDCLSRFVMQSRFTTPNLDVVVDDVTAAGCSLFYNDPVAAVVRPTEVLAVHIRNVASTDVLPRRIAVHTNAAAAVEVSPADISVIKVSTAPTTAPAPLPSADLKRTRDQTPATEPAERQPRRTQPPPVPPVTIIPEPAAAVKAAKTKALGWGNASHKTYPQNYVADPEQMIRELRKQKAAQAKLAAEKKAAEKAAAAAEAANAPVLVDDITQKPMPALAAVPTNTSIASLSKLELYCDADIQEMQRRPLVTHNVARQLTYA